MVAIYKKWKKFIENLFKYPNKIIKKLRNKYKINYMKKKIKRRNL
jgi:hypothetical protein